MTVDPNHDTPPQAELPLESAAAEPLELEAPAPPATPSGVDVDVLADRVIEKLMSAAQSNAPDTQTQTYQAGSPMDAAIEEMKRRASDPTHVLHADAVIQLELMRSRGVEDEWNALGCPPGHPARALYAQSPQAFSMRPRHAFVEWDRQELRRGQVSNNEKARAQAEQEKADVAARAARDSTPGMPTRSVEPRTGLGRLSMTQEEFQRRVLSEPDLDDKADQGLIDWKT